jgi:hypothetical protein
MSTLRSIDRIAQPRAQASAQARSTVRRTTSRERRRGLVARGAGAVLLGLAGIAAVGCTGKAAPEQAIASAAGVVHEGVLGYKSVTDEVVRLASSGVVDVDLELFAGSVTIDATPSKKETTVAVRRMGTHGWGRDDESMRSLGEINYTITLEQRGPRQAAVVRAGSDTYEPHFQRVDVVIETPELGSVRIRTSRGEIWVSGNQGPLDIETSRGKVRAMTGWPMTEPMTIVTTDGLIDLRLRGESTGVFDAETVGGEVKTRVKYGRWIALDRTNDDDTMRATLNDGSNPIVLRTSNDDILVSIVGDPISTSPYPPIP